MFSYKVEKEKKSKQGFMSGVMALMISQVIIKVLGLVYKWYLTNKEGFGDRGNAIYSAGFGIYALLLTISSTGVPNAVSKLVSEHNARGDYKGANKIFKISLGLFAAIGLSGTLILFFGANYISNVLLSIPEAELSLVSLSPAIFFVAVISVFRGYFNGREDMRATANSQTMEQLCKTIFTILIVEMLGISSGLNTKLMAAGANLATTFATVTSFMYLYKYFKERRKELDKEIILSKKYNTKSIIGIIKKILTVSFPMSLSAILISINRNIDSITVKRGLETFLDKGEALKQYGILSGKIDTLITLPLSFNIAFSTALVPTITSAKAKGKIETANKRVSFSLLITILIGLPCMVGMIIFAKQILELLFPNANDGSLIFQISALSIIFTVIEQTINGALQGIGKIMVPAIALTIGVTVKFILNIILVPIPEIGASGAAIATTACHAIACIIGFCVLVKNMNLNMSVSKFVFKPIIATGMMAICSKVVYILLCRIYLGKVVTIISILVAILVYILSIIELKIFNKEELLMIPYGQKICKILNKIGFYKEM